MANILSIVGRPNVGKSTLFNRLTQTQHAIVDSVSGVTRDRHYGFSDWNGISFSVIDTGGIIVGSEDVFEEAIIEQAKMAIEESDVVLFLVDAREGLTPLDRDVADLIRRSDKKCILGVNKVDTPDKEYLMADFYSLGIEDIFPISAQNGGGTGDLLDLIVKNFNPEVDTTLPDLPKIAIVGKPNVGKSSFINTILGTERNIVTPIAGTTRDSIYTQYSAFGFDFLLIDTAGLRKKSKVNEDLEFYSVMRAIRSIENSDVCILMVDATEGFGAQDMNIFKLIQNNNKGIVIAVNKWDLVEKDTNTTREFETIIKNTISPFTDVPIVFTSVVNKQRIHKTLQFVSDVYKNRNRKIPTRLLNDTLLPIVKEKEPPVYKGKDVKIKYITQIKTAYPTFIFFCNLPQYIKDPYKRFLENQIREKFNFTGVPIKLYFRKK
ncbi:MAG: ribosome biogenesis GTPase Der [Lentimicrobiaceae bacterium]|nr:ribosome biogenesis GTPase Der [Lentimicrobiaceae bacterium]